ncbi:FKBP-type peptidyl-prolyl cis-trans isomerase [Isoptericola sp. NEAU-Y5]|uniref:peptidylprolyl isomerase n=1 Tax=Isoptericola luteus TaxID=2879484 RepID=A0ABS7ZI92_9MICO|nr:FKBP-type peptidyl-prolyl cis-trans isomerase [Isoptericola sp. NEAU-Y5]MCA5893539.1 FKBP-type peptidyl-prolyl cis-trans isomerase [Isoptericola sp. NEAU-Y5]
MPRRATPLLALLLGSTLALTGCSSSVLRELTPTQTPSQAPVQVSGAVGEPPSLDYGEPYTVVQPGSRTIWPGTGHPVADGEPVLLNMHAEDGTDGAVISSTFMDAPAWYTMSPESLGSNLYDTLRGQRVGARLLLVEEDGGVPVILVIDVLPTRAAGNEVPTVEGLPEVERADDGTPYVKIPEDAKAPGDLVVQPLVRGSGPQVQVGQVVTMRFTAVRWSDGRAFDSTWEAGARPQSATIGIGQLIEGLDEGLLEQTVGSQVMIVVPPSLGYGGTSSDLADQTLVYVVDILDTHFQVTDADIVPEDETEEQPPEEDSEETSEDEASDRADEG